MKIRKFMALMLSTAVATFSIGAVSAADTFELEGNITVDSTIDWSSLFDVSGDAVPEEKEVLPNGYSAATFVRDFIPGKKGPDSTTFTTGSKDTLDILGGWECTTSNNLGDKFDIVNIYATAYLNDSNQVILYFALERNGNEGDGNVGFWFLQSGEVGCDITQGKTASFTGNHVDGDLLVVSEFSNGGTVSTIEVYEWQGGALSGSPSVTGGECGPGGVGSGACAIVNDSLLNGYGNATDVPWLTETKQPGNTPSNDLDVSKFFEGGVNLTANGLEACFSTFMGVTRSSTSLTATLFDYALGEFPLCAISVTKTCDTVKLNSINGDQLLYDVNFTASVTNDGLAPIAATETITIVDNAGTGVPGESETSDDVTVVTTVGAINNGAAWEPGETIIVDGVDANNPNITGTFVTDTNGVYNTVKAHVTLAGSDTGLSDFGENDCSQLTLSPMMSVTKNCVGSELVPYDGGNVLAVQNAFEITVCNTGTAPLTNVSVSDTTAGYSPATFDLDFAKLCNSDSDCGDGGTCSANTFKQCKTGGVFTGDYCTASAGDSDYDDQLVAQCGADSATFSCEVNDLLTVNQCDNVGEFGGDVCFSSTPDGGNPITYFPTVLQGENGTSTNSVTVSAELYDSPQDIMGSASANCDLCPTPYVAPSE